MPMRSREIRLAARPRGAPVPSDFELAEVEVPDPADGEILVRNTYVSVDPYMRGRMNDVKSYVPPFALGEPLTGGAVGQVVASRNDDWPEGTWVVHDLGWREAARRPTVAACARSTTTLAPVSTALGVLGMPGLTAFVGIVDIGAVAEGETVFVSGRGGRRREHRRAARAGSRRARRRQCGDGGEGRLARRARARRHVRLHAGHDARRAARAGPGRRSTSTSTTSAARRSRRRSAR